MNTVDYLFRFWYTLPFLSSLLPYRLCRTYWPFCSAYENWREKPDLSFRILFLRLDEARLTFNSDAFEGMRYLHENKILNDDVQHIALYLHVTPGLNPDQKRRYLEAK